MDDPRLGPDSRLAIAGERNEVFVSAASAWEITTKHRIGKLPGVGKLAADIGGYLQQEGFVPLSVTVAHAEHAGRLEGLHKDPFDRMLIAQAVLDKLTLISNEAAFDGFGVSRLW